MILFGWSIDQWAQACAATISNPTSLRDATVVRNEWFAMYRAHPPRTPQVGKTGYEAAKDLFSSAGFKTERDNVL